MGNSWTNTSSPWMDNLMSKFTDELWHEINQLGVERDNIFKAVAHKKWKGNIQPRIEELEVKAKLLDAYTQWKKLTPPGPQSVPESSGEET